MRRGDGAILLFTLVVLWPSLLLAQKPPLLEEQLRAQYESGTVLTIQKQGVFAVASTSSKLCAVRYQDGKLNPAESSCLATLNSATRILTVGEKINPSNVDVDLAKERISFRIVECDSCNKGVQSASFKSQIDFQFAKGYLERADVPQVVDAISEVLAFPDVAVEQPPQQASPPDQPGQQPDGALTNNDVIKMARVKLGDGIVISKIKASPCNFDTSVDALVKLKEAGVSDAVIQAMHDAQEAAKAPPEPSGNGRPSEGNPVAGHYMNDVSAAEYIDLGSDGSFLLKTAQGDTVLGSYESSADTLTVQRAGKAVYRFRVDGERLIGQEGYIWTRRGEPPPAAGPAAVTGQVSFSFRHRHRLMNGNWQILDYYCSGTLSVSKDGTVAYDCDQTEIPSGRCEKRLSLAPGSVKEVKVGSGGSLHLASRKQGNFDFYGNADDIKQAQAAIAPFVQTAQK